MDFVKCFVNNFVNRFVSLCKLWGVGVGAFLFPLRNAGRAQPKDNGPKPQHIQVHKQDARKHSCEHGAQAGMVQAELAEVTTTLQSNFEYYVF